MYSTLLCFSYPPLGVFLGLGCFLPSLACLTPSALPLAVGVFFTTERRLLCNLNATLVVRSKLEPLWLKTELKRLLLLKMDLLILFLVFCVLTVSLTKEYTMPKPQSKAHKMVAYTLSEKRGTKQSMKPEKRIANKGDRKASKLALKKFA